MSALPLFSPFRGERYSDAGSLAKRLAPPYDVIGPELRAELASRDKANIVHVDLPPAGAADPYAEAARVLADWRAKGVLERDSEPCAYVLRTTSSFEDGITRSRTGVFLAVAAEPFKAGRVRPHEKTHAGPKEDRRRLTHATATNLSPIFMLAPDTKGDLAMLLTASTRKQSWATAEAIGATHEVWVERGGAAERIAAAAGAEPAYIADGHHRYETAVVIRDEAPMAWRSGAERTLAHVVSFQDPGLAILPTHRVVEGQALAREAVLKAASPYFSRALANQQPTLRVAFADGSVAAMVLRPDADLSAAADLPVHPSVRALSVAVADSVLVRVVLASVMGGHADLRYTPSEAEAVSSFGRGDVALAILLPATRLADVRAVSDAGEVMPPKSTYFAPKVPTGVVLRPLT